MANKFPFVFDKPFASEGDFVLPKFEANPKVANWPQGFSGRFSDPPEDGGLFIEREAMNGIHNALSQNQAWQQSGQLPTFDPEYVAKSGGYPRGAVLWNIPAVQIKMNLANTVIPPSSSSWCGIGHYYYKYNTISTYYPVALMSTRDNNTSNFVENQQFIGDAWFPLFPDARIEDFISDISQSGETCGITVHKFLRRPPNSQIQTGSISGYVKIVAQASKAHLNYGSIMGTTPIPLWVGTAPEIRQCIVWEVPVLRTWDNTCELLNYSSPNTRTNKKLLSPGNFICIRPYGDNLDINEHPQTVLFPVLSGQSIFYTGSSLTINPRNSNAIFPPAQVNAEYYTGWI